MSKPTEASKLAALEKSLPSQICEAAHEVSIAEQHLAQVLTLRAAGEPIKGADISIARMALGRALRDAEDLGRIQGILPAMLELECDTARAENGHAAQQTWTGASVVLLAGD